MTIGRLVLLGCFSLAHGARPIRDPSLKGEEIKVMAFSDVHGVVTPKKDAPPDTPPANNLQDLKDQIERERTPGHQIMTTKVDLLIYGGDMSQIPFGKFKPNKEATCQPQNKADITAFIEWFGGITTATRKVLIAGNHDVCLDEHLARTVDDNATVQELRQLMVKKGITYLNNECKLVKIDDSKSVHVLGSPLSACRSDKSPGAFQWYPPKGPDVEKQNAHGKILYHEAIQQLKAASASCPNPIVVIHGPPDNADSGEAISSKELKEEHETRETGTMTDAILNMKPQVVLAGHFHASGPKFGYFDKEMSLKSPTDEGGGNWYEGPSAAPAKLIMTAIKKTAPGDREEGGTFTVPPVSFVVDSLK